MNTFWHSSMVDLSGTTLCIAMQDFGGNNYFWANADCKENYRYLCEVGLCFEHFLSPGFLAQLSARGSGA